MTSRRVSSRRKSRTNKSLFISLLLLFNFDSLVSESSGKESLIDKDKILNSMDWLENQDFDWYKANVPFLETPDKEIDATYYYRWELVTRHICYGSPNSGYLLTEFANRPFWSGAYGAIACPSGHQFYEIRWMHNPHVARDYLRYWFRTKGAQPRKYSSWLADSAWAVHQVHPNEEFILDLFPDLLKNFQGWEERHWVKEMNMFWQTGHDDGMEFNINSRQTKDILRGDRAFRPTFNSYMWADATALAKIAALKKDRKLEKEYQAIAGNLKKQIQKKLWDPKRNFFFPMSSREETDKEGNVVNAYTLTYQSGKFAGNPHGRELHGYVPWAFNIPDEGYESAWKFLMDPEYFYAPFGPRTTEVNDPLYVLKTGCCWWSGQSWPFATAQTLKAMANVLHFYNQDVISKKDYLTILHNFAISQRKDGKPYIAEALNPDDGSWRGHDMRNRSEHYFHSSFNDQIITGLIGLQPSSDISFVIDPLAPESWDYFAMDSIPYKGHMISVIWDRKGDRYVAGKGFHVFIDGKKVKTSKVPTKLRISLPSLKKVPMDKNIRLNYAVNNDGDYYPRYEASFTSKGTSLSKIYDGEYVYDRQPANRWTTDGSNQKSDWLVCDLGEARILDTLKLYIIDDGQGVLAPLSFTCEYWKDEKWIALPNQTRKPKQAAGKRANIVTFPAMKMRKIRFIFKNAQGAGSGLTELQAWGPGRLPYIPPPPPKGNIALNRGNKVYPKATASYSDRYGGVAKSAIDGRIIFQSNPVNRWTSYGSPNKTDWLEIDFGQQKLIKKVVLHIYDDHGGVQTPLSYSVHYFKGNKWKEVGKIQKSPIELMGSSENIGTFAPIRTSKIRVMFVHKGKARSGLTELEVW